MGRRSFRVQPFGASAGRVGAWPGPTSKLRAAQSTSRLQRRSRHDKRFRERRVASHCLMCGWRTLEHRGVLLLDELPAFNPPLEWARRPDAAARYDATAL